MLYCMREKYYTLENGIFCGFRFLLPEKEIKYGNKIDTN